MFYTNGTEKQQHIIYHNLSTFTKKKWYNIYKKSSQNFIGYKIYKKPLQNFLGSNEVHFNYVSTRISNTQFKSLFDQISMIILK